MLVDSRHDISNLRAMTKWVKCILRSTLGTGKHSATNWKENPQQIAKKKWIRGPRAVASPAASGAAICPFDAPADPSSTYIYLKIMYLLKLQRTHTLHKHTHTHTHTTASVYALRLHVFGPDVAPITDFPPCDFPRYCWCCCYLQKLFIRHVDNSRKCNLCWKNIA